MYQLVWATKDGSYYSIIGDLESLYQVYYGLIKHIKDKLNILELWKLGAPTVKIKKDGIAVSWWSN